MRSVRTRALQSMSRPLPAGPLELAQSPQDRAFRALFVAGFLTSSAFYSPGFYPTLEVSPSVSQAISSPIASLHRALCSGSYTSPLTQRWCSTTESLRATATTARFLAFLPPREAIFWPWRLRSESWENGPRM